jgi:hypothetical protein
MRLILLYQLLSITSLSAAAKSTLATLELNSLWNHGHRLEVGNFERQVALLHDNIDTLDDIGHVGVICVPLDTNTFESVEELERIHGLSLYPLHVDEEVHTACFHGRIPKALILKSTPDMRVLFVPALLKIHLSIATFLETRNDLEEGEIPGLFLVFNPSRVDTTHEKFMYKTNIKDFAASLFSFRPFTNDDSERGVLGASLDTGFWSAHHESTNDHADQSDTDCQLDEKDLIINENYIVVRPRWLSTVPKRCIVSLVEYAAIQPEIIRIAAEHLVPTLANFEARGITQNGRKGYEPFTKAGLLGAGQIVGLTDSGIDDFNCVFHDDSKNYSTQFTARDGTLELGRRKLIQYIVGPGSTGYDSMGHGTHTAGTVAGNCLNGRMDCNGMAPEAKITIYDFYNEISESYGDVQVDVILDAQYQAGAYISSNSWGMSNNNQYSTIDWVTDNYLYAHQDLLVVFASGNNGALGNGTILSPCYAKNTLCVGAGTVRLDPNDTFIIHQTVAYFSSNGPTNDLRYGIDVIGPGDYVVSSWRTPLAQQVNAQESAGGSMFSLMAEASGTSMATPAIAGQYFINCPLWSL